MREAPAQSPVHATWLGDHRFDSRLDDLSQAAIDGKLRLSRDLLAEMAALRREELAESNQIDAAMLEHHLRSEVWHLETLQEWAWNPTVYTALAGNAIYHLLARDFAPLGDRLLAAAARLEQFPRLLEQVRQVLQPARVPQVHTQTAIQQNKGIASILDQLVQPPLDDLPPADRDRLDRALAAARLALQVHQRWLEEDLLPRSTGNFRLGRELYDRKLAFTLHSPLGRQEIRRQAQDEFDRVRAEMRELAAQVRSLHPDLMPAEGADDQGLIAAALELASQDALEPDQIVQAARDALADATAFVAAADLVSLPDEPCEVIVMPEFRRGVSLAYCDSPGPLETHQPTFYAIAPPPADWSAQQVRSLLREYNRRSLRNLTVHEATPGHFLQLTRANRCPSRLRKMLASGVFIEGWAVYAEHLMIEQGFAGEDPLARLVVLKWYLRSIVNAILDQAVHVDGIQQEEAMELMRRGAFQEEREAAGKWTRAQLTSAQLSTYFVGFREHQALREEVRRAWGSSFSLRRYHDTLLSFGSPPTQYVRKWIVDSGRRG